VGGLDGGELHGCKWEEVKEDRCGCGGCLSEGGVRWILR